MSKGRDLYERIERILTGKGYAFLDFGCWQIEGYCGVIHLGWNENGVTFTTCDQDGIFMAQQVELETFEEFEVLLGLLEVFAYGKPMPLVFDKPTQCSNSCN